MSENATRSLAERVIRDPVHWLPFGLGTGLLPWFPGTWGSLLAVLAFWLAPPMGLVSHLGLAAALFVAGIGLCQASAARLQMQDPGGIVLDEIVGMWAVLAFTERRLAWMGAAFVAFRLADIFKPWPIREVDHRLHGGLGIMLDDLLAAIYAAIAVMLLQWVVGGA